MTATQILKKHGITPNKNTRAKSAVDQVNKKLAKVGLQIVSGKEPSIIVAGKGQKVIADKSTRAGMMMLAKQRGIKYFRILNKAELAEVLREGTTPVRIKNIQDAANARWHSGWGSKKKEGI